jgi:two-component system chemotaxis response regulator CheY
MKVLVVEDSSSMRAYLTTILESGSESYDLEIVEAASGFEALKTLPHHKFDAILTDINMPDINGLELVSFLKNHPVYKTIPIMVISTESTTASTVFRPRSPRAAPTESVPLFSVNVPSQVLDPRRAMVCVPSFVRLPLVIVPEKHEYP